MAFAFVVGCSAKAPPSTGDSPTPRTTPELGPPSSRPVGGNAEAATLPPPDQREAALSETVLQLFEREHLLRKHLDDSVSRDAYKTYLDRLDGTKMYLLQSDREALDKYADKIDDELRAGSLDLAHDGAKIQASRLAQIEKWVDELLAKPFDHTNEEFVELDPKKLQPAATEADLRERWRQRLELEVLERVAQMETRLKPPKPDPKKKKDAKKDDDEEDDKRAIPVAQIPPTPEGRDAKARADLAKAYAGRFARLKNPGPLDAASNLVNAVASSLDPHTTYLPPADKANFDIHMSGSLEGIGAVLRERDHYIEIIEIVPGGATAKHGGVTAGDLIMSVQQDGKDPVDVLDMKIDDVVKMVRGPKGTVVRLRIQKAAGNEETVAITRDVVVVEDTYARGAVIQHKSGPQYGYIHLPGFYGGKNSPRTSAVDMKKLFIEMRTRKVAGVIIDIRSNGGGLLSDAVDITGDLIDEGPVVMVQDSRGKREILGDDQKGIEYDGPVVVLVDRFSASASEILAGALQDYKRAIIVGTGATHGKGTVQTLADLDRATGGKIELGSLKITIQQFFRVSGSSTQREGVTPDILLPDNFAYVESGERELDHAIAWSSIPAAQYVKWPGAARWNLPVLAQRSAARVAKQPMLSKIATTTAILKTRRNDTRVPLAKAAWEARRVDLRKALDAASPDYKALPASLVVKPIDDPALPAKLPDANGKTDDRIAKWADNLAKDPWVDEGVNILGDMPR
ncbi:MAG: carboxy terminal-processing peptidase [Kofleriaceae bacterium]